MFKVFGSAALVASFALILASAGAQDGDKGKRKKGDFAKNPEETFKKLDTNSDNRLSKDEFLKIAERAKDAEKAEKFKEALTKVFTAADTEMKGLSLDQFKEAQKKIIEGFKKKKDNQ